MIFKRLHTHTQSKDFTSLPCSSNRILSGLTSLKETITGTYEKWFVNNLNTEKQPHFSCKHFFPSFVKTLTKLICTSIHFCNVNIQLVALILQSGSIKPVRQDKRGRRDEIIESQTCTTSLENMMEIQHFCLFHVLVRGTLKSSHRFTRIRFFCLQLLFCLFVGRLSGRLKI